MQCNVIALHASHADLRIKFLPEREQRVSVMRICRLMLFEDTVAAYSDC
jgi:hypothetical protein